MSGNANMFRYIEENYSKIRDVEREFASLSMEMKLTAGPKKSGCYNISASSIMLQFCGILSSLY